jgi:DNA-binding beta-propeller fold protein YncE
MQKILLFALLSALALTGCGKRLPVEQTTATTQALILSPTQNRFLIFNTLVHRVEGWVETGQVPRDLVLGPDGLFFIANQMESAISVFQRNDRSTLYRVGKIGTVDKPHRLAYSAPFRELWAASETLPRLAVYRVMGLTQPPLKQFVNLPQATQISGLALSADGNQLWIADQATPRLLQVQRDGDSYRVSEWLKLPEGSRISDLGQVGDRLFALDEFLDQMYIINPATGQLETTLDLREKAEDKRPLLLERMVANHSGSKLYLTASGTSAVLVVDPKAKKLLQTLYLNGPDVKFPAYAPLGVAINRDDTRLYVTAQQGRNLALIETSPDPAVSDKILNTMGTSVSEALLPPLGAIRIIEQVPD